jgi:hypothetical protein
LIDAQRAFAPSLRQSSSALALPQQFIPADQLTVADALLGLLSFLTGTA